MYLLTDEIYFPDPSNSTEEGIVAIGGDLSIDRLIMAYKKGIFPWFNQEEIPLWWSPDPRCVLFTKEVKISKSMRNVLNRNEFKFTADQAFDTVIEKCGEVRKYKEGTWITNEFIEAYTQLHKMGIAHSVEVWQEDQLVGGLYGLSFGNMFFGESMFSLVNNASKAAFIRLAQQLSINGFEIIDCQIHTDHLASMGAIEIPRTTFLEKLKDSLSANHPPLIWRKLFSNL